MDEQAQTVGFDGSVQCLLVEFPSLAEHAFQPSDQGDSCGEQSLGQRYREGAVRHDLDEDEVDHLGPYV